jgi:quercetin 2,3-dioxygenase
VSNLERDPRETVCGAATATLTAPPPFRLLQPREVPLGGPRGIEVRRTLPHREVRTVGAWCFADHYGPHPVTAGRGMRVPPHPHTGLQTVTWLLQGEVLHRDSLGTTATVRPGELNLMSAGRGVAHSEETPRGSTVPLEGLQLWLAQPAGERARPACFAQHVDLPVVHDGAATVTVFVGEHAGAASPARTATPLVGADVVVSASAPVRLPLEPSYEHAVLALSEGISVAGRAVPRGSMLHLGTGRSDVAVTAAATGRLALLGGAPFDEPLLMWWNFVARGHDEIESARRAWEAERATGEVGGRFGMVVGYDGPPLPAPSLPSTPLLARRNVTYGRG